MKKVSVFLSGANVQCIGKFDPKTNHLVISAGSKIRKNPSQAFKYAEKRIKQISEYCVEDKESYVLKVDVEFDTPTAAAKFSLGYEVNGLVFWRCSDKTKLKDYINSLSVNK